MKLVMMKGLPGSGKSTYARKLVDEGYVRVNKDDLRKMLDNGKYSPAKEKFVLKCRDYIIATALSHGKSVVVDDTNFEEKHLTALKNAATTHKAEFKEVFIDTPLDECIKRDLQRTDSVGETVIRRMYKQYLREIETPKEAVENCIIVDIDGTLAHMDGRSPYDESLVLTDTADQHVRFAALATKVAAKKVDEDIEVIIMSGRHESCREDTVEWLKREGILYDQLHMRATGDDRKDFIIKSELYEEHINGKYNVLFVLDDRNQVVDMWRQKGLKCFQVAEGDF